ncbi:FAD binding domain-containing protein [Streptomyces umbrinus]|uniref:FAD binding domain-containing protein n=1 Tax=Streptomyces umbrinus TaxID=67370 RepID=UPI00167BF3C6|nr:FAD binding domain-containing protein [Streptomyces umbrinus]
MTTTLHVPRTLDEALGTLAPLAGGTWVMRTPLREEPWAEGYVAVAGLPELRTRDRNAGELRLGAGLTHAETADATRAAHDLRALHQAAAHSANPGARQRATLGGNLSTARFPAPDLVTALLCLDASLTVADRQGQRDVPVANYLRSRDGSLVTCVSLPRTAARTGHARLPLRRAGDYPVAIVSVALVTGADDTVVAARVAVGSVEPVPRRWPEAERLLLGRPADPAAAKETAAACTGSVTGRDGVDAPGWYRERVLPTLLARAVDAALAPETTRSGA